jgi:NitT/TauT family transport system ATP-binding protein/sulfonate transport system ATP-binding protein
MSHKSQFIFAVGITLAAWNLLSAKSGILPLPFLGRFRGPKALLLDEPLGALDAFTRVELQEKLLEMWRATKSTMLLVTHGVDEAICLSDRIVIMTPRPGEISEVIDVALNRPRARNEQNFAALRIGILEKLHIASNRPEPEYRI